MSVSDRHFSLADHPFHCSFDRVTMRLTTSLHRTTALFAVTFLVACSDNDTGGRPASDTSFPDISVADATGTPDTSQPDTSTDSADGASPLPDVADVTTDVSADVEPDAGDAAISDDGSGQPEDTSPPLLPLSVTIDDRSTADALSAEVRFAEPVSAFALRPSASSGPCAPGIQLHDEALDRCVGLTIRWTSADQAIIQPARSPRPGAALSWRVTAGTEDGFGTRAVTADVVEPVSLPTVEPPTPWSLGVTIDGVDDFPPSATITEAGGARFSATWDAENLYVGVTGYDLTVTNQALYVAVGARRDSDDNAGAAGVPQERWFEGAPVILPFHASHLFFTKAVDGRLERYQRTHTGVVWGGRTEGTFRAAQSADHTELAIPWSSIGDPERLELVIYLRDLASDCAGACADDLGFGWLYAASDPLFQGGPFLRALESSRSIDRTAATSPAATPIRHRFGRDERPAIYQLLVRTFSNVNQARIPDGTLEQNGTGRFADINDSALRAIAEMGFTHVWFTGVLQQATSTDWSEYGQPADDPDILKGRAGSPYAVRDYFDVSPDYAVDPAARNAEFAELIDRTHDAGLQVMIDLVPNHVARSYLSDIRSDVTFGEGDDTSVFFNRDNSFFYLQSGAPPVYLPGYAFETPLSPTCQSLTDDDYRCDGVYDWQGRGETTLGRVTGNNVASWTPDINTWYETVKVNYGFDYTNGTVLHPTMAQPGTPVPRSWLIVDEIVEHWQGLGVDGFRVDMAHMVPPDFMAWMVGRARVRNPEVIWVAEAYDDDPAKVVAGNTLHSLLESGFDAVYDDGTYDRLKAIYDGGGWANDASDWMAGDPVLAALGLRYAENHDEVRLASRWDWQFGGRNVGLEVGPALSAVLWGAGRGPFLHFAGQETGEPASGAEGFGGDDGRTTIFDYWSMPTLVPWVGATHTYDASDLPEASRALREEYIRLARLMAQDVFARGEVWPLNDANRSNPSFGRVGDETVSGHWMTAIARWLPRGDGDGRLVLIVANLHPETTASDVRVQLPAGLWQRVAPTGTTAVVNALWGAEDETSASLDAVLNQGIPAGELAGGDARVLEIEFR